MLFRSEIFHFCQNGTRQVLSNLVQLDEGRIANCFQNVIEPHMQFVDVAKIGFASIVVQSIFDKDMNKINKKGHESLLSSCDSHYLIDY